VRRSSLSPYRIRLSWQIFTRIIYIGFGLKMGQNVSFKASEFSLNVFWAIIRAWNTLQLLTALNGNSEVNLYSMTLNDLNGRPAGIQGSSREAIKRQPYSFWLRWKRQWRNDTIMATEDGMHLPMITHNQCHLVDGIILLVSSITVYGGILHSLPHSIISHFEYVNVKPPFYCD